MRIVGSNLSFTYNKRSAFATKALDGVSLEIQKGEFFGIIGHTGSGKSTFIQHLNGLITVDEGALSVGEHNLKFYTKKQFKNIRMAGTADAICFKNGEKISYRAYKKRRVEDLKRLRSEVGMVFQYPEYQLFGETVFADVAFGLKNFYPSLKDEEVEAAVRGAIERVGLNYEEVKDKSPFDLSGGQKRRVAIAGVIVSRPKILVLDEPVAGLDPAGKKELLKLLHDLHGNVCQTVIIVSHDMDDVAENCTRVAVFSDGKLMYVLPPKELFKKSAELKAVGLDVPMTASLVEKLKTFGLDIDTDFTADDFAAKIAAIYKSGLNLTKNEDSL